MDAGAKRMMRTLVDEMLGGMLKEQFPAMAEVEKRYVSSGPEQQVFDSIEDLNIREVRRLLKTGKVDAAARNKDGWTGLHLACLKGLTEIARLLIAAGAPVDSKTVPFQETPLHIAATYGFYDIVVMLLDKGASIFAHDWKGLSVLQCTENLKPWVKMGPMEKARKLLKEKASEAKPLEKVKRREDGCGMCGKKDKALKQCARCKLQWYCSPECQKGDWKLHKPR